MLLVAVQAVSHSVAIAYPRVVEYAVDVASDRPTALPDALPNIGGVLLGLFLLGTTLSWFSEYWGVRLSEEIACAVRVRAMEGVYAQSVAVLEEIVPSEIVDRLSRDAASVARLLQMGLGGAATVLQALLAVVMMLSIDSWMSMLSLCIIPVIGVAVLLLGRVMQSASARHRQAEVAASQVVGEMFRGVRVIQAFSQVERELERYRGAARQASTAIRPVGRWSGMMRSLGEFATAALVTIVAVLGTSRLVEGQLSTGSLTAFLMYTYMLIMAVSMAASQFGAVRRMLGSTRPLIRMLELPRGSRPRRAAKSDDRHSADRFAIDLLTYAYPSRPLSPVVNGVSFELRSGEMLAIVGRSGAGKSTLVKLLLQFIQPTFGRIWLGGREYQDVDPKAWRRHIGYVEQEPTLMTGNIAYNIAYGRPDASEEDIKEAARRAHIHDVIDGLPEGYETHVGDTGTRLSGGQKQRLALARALLLEPDVLILDEPASHLDSESEAAVSASIEEFRANGGMVIIIAHGLKSIQGAAQILVMDKGHPVGLGNHVDLMRENPSYRYLAELQMAEEELEVEVTALFQERALIDDP